MVPFQTLCFPCLYCTCPLLLIIRRSLSVPRSFLSIGSLSTIIISSIDGPRIFVCHDSQGHRVLCPLCCQSNSRGVVGGSRLVLSCGIFVYSPEFLSSRGVDISSRGQSFLRCPDLSFKNDPDAVRHLKVTVYTSFSDNGFFVQRINASASAYNWHSIVQILPHVSARVLYVPSERIAEGSLWSAG